MIFVEPTEKLMYLRLGMWLQAVATQKEGIAPYWQWPGMHDVYRSAITIQHNTGEEGCASASSTGVIDKIACHKHVRPHVRC
jgi:hypothetical protein